MFLRSCESPSSVAETILSRSLPRHDCRGYLAPPFNTTTRTCRNDHTGHESRKTQDERPPFFCDKTSQGNRSVSSLALSSLSHSQLLFFVNFTRESPRSGFNVSGLWPSLITKHFTHPKGHAIIAILQDGVFQ